MSQGRGIDYKGTCFKYPEVQKIYGEPTLSLQLELRGNIKANAMKVHLSLSDGQHEHLDMTCHPEEYAEIPDTVPYERPKNHGILEVEGGTAFEIAQQKSEHEEATRLFREVIGVERTLIQQLISAIEPIFLQALQNPVTGQINRSIPKIFDYFYSNFGNVIPDELSDLKTARRK